MAHSNRAPSSLARTVAADLRACPHCGGLVDARMRTCPACGHWLGPGALRLWLSLIISGSLLIVLAFFLPWLNGAGAAAGRLLSGYDLAQIAQHLAGGAEARPTAAASIALYLAPIAGVSILVLVLLALTRRPHWSLTGRVIVALAAMPLQLALLAALFAMGLLGRNETTGWPHIGLLITGLGSLLAIVGGITLGGPGRPLLSRRRSTEY